MSAVPDSRVPESDFDAPGHFGGPEIHDCHSGAATDRRRVGRTVRRALGVLVTAGLVSAVGGLASAGVQEGPPDSKDSQLGDAARRWERLDPEQQAEMMRRFESFKQLPEADRERMRTRAAELRNERGRLRESLAPGDLDRLESMGPLEREEAMRRHHEDFVRERGERMREILPRTIVKQLEALPPHERPRFLHSWTAGLRDRLLRKAVKRAAQGSGLDEAQVKTMLGLPAEQQIDELRKLVSKFEGERPPWAPAPRPVPPALAAHPELLEELVELSWPTFEDGLAAKELERHERKEFIGQRVIDRALAHAEASGLLSDAELGELRTTDPRDLMRMFRAEKPGLPFHGGRGRGIGSGGPPHEGFPSGGERRGPKKDRLGGERPDGGDRPDGFDRSRRGGPGRSKSSGSEGREGSKDRESRGEAGQREDRDGSDERRRSGRDPR